MRVVGITGTNGKTTTTSLLAHVVRCAGEPAARVTTLGSWIDDEQLSDQTDVDAFFRCLERARDAGARTLILEITSKALAEGFAHHYPVQVAVLTSFSRDHLDYHGSPEQYLAAKAQLFATMDPSGVAVLPRDGEAGALIAELVPGGAEKKWFSRREADANCVRIAGSEVSWQGTHVRLEDSALARDLGLAHSLRLHGDHFAEDAVAAALAARALGYSREVLGTALASFAGVPGRFELVGQDPPVVVDYAHTPDALERTLTVARQLAGASPVIVVFGCGGERDREKRPQMGEVAARLAHVTILTSDNPRSESADDITAQIAAGAMAAGAVEEDLEALRRMDPAVLDRPRVVAQGDRRKAIAAAISLGRTWNKGVVIIAGKGHEKVQWIGSTSHPFDDVRVARSILEGPSQHEGPG
ncbi:MAG: UDP-N-acetylmuramyl-tripeptide synthetase [Polyangiaceae bacterium]